MRSLKSILLGLFSLVFLTVDSEVVAARIIDFEDIVLAAESTVTGPAAVTTTQPGAFDSEDAVGFLESGGVQFINRSSITFEGSWNGFAFSNRTDNTTPGFTSGTSSFTGGGFGEGADNYAIIYDSVRPVEATTIEQLQQTPFLDLPDGHRALSARVTNTTYSALSMLNGDMFAKKFGGTLGTDQDYLLLTISGSNIGGKVLQETVEVYMADYRSPDPAQDRVVGVSGEWAEVDLSPLATADRLYFHFESTDGVGIFTNTPTYVALDDLVIEATGDFDGDGRLTFADMDIFCRGLQAESNQQFDLNADGIVSADDVSAMLAIANRLPGDADFNGHVEFIDFLVLADHYGKAASWSGGDFDCDGETQFGDFLTLADTFGQSSVDGTAIGSVPEPASRWSLDLWIALMILVVRCRVKRN